MWILADYWRDDCAASLIRLDRATNDDLQHVTSFLLSTVAVTQV